MMIGAANSKFIHLAGDFTMPREQRVKQHCGSVVYFDADSVITVVEILLVQN